MKKTADILLLTGGIIEIVCGSIAVLCLYPFTLISGIFALYIRKHPSKNMYITGIVFSVLGGGIVTLTGHILGLVSESAPEIDNPEAKPKPEPKEKDPVDRINELKDLLDKGAITQEEYDKLKEEQLKRMKTE